MPAGPVGDADITDLARADQCIEGRQRFFGRSLCIKAMQLDEIDVIGAQPFQRRVHRLQNVEARRAHVIGAIAAAEGEFGGDQNLVAPPLDRGAQNFLRRTAE